MSDHVHPHDEARGDAHPLPVARRRFLQTTGMALAGGVLFSCTGGRTIPKVSDDPVTPTIDTATPIKRVIYIMLENRSFNNVFGTVPRRPGRHGRGRRVRRGEAADRLPGMAPRRPARTTAPPTSRCVNDGSMDGFGIGAYGIDVRLHRLQRTPDPELLEVGQEYALSDNFFASAAGPSYANHYYFIAGQSGGVIDNPENIETRFRRRQAVQELGLRRLRRGRVRVRQGRARAT